MSAEAGQTGRRNAGFAWRLSAFYAAVFLVTGTSLPFLPVWLDWRGLSLAEISIVTAAPLFARIVMAPAIGYMADRWGEHRKVLILLAWLAFALLVALNGVRGFWAILAVTLLIAVAWTSISPLAETVAMAGVRGHGLDYGRMRLWGSLSFIAASFGGGLILAATGTGWAVWLMVAGAAATVMAAHVLPVPASAAQTVSQGVPPTRADIVQLATSRGFLLFLLAAGSVQASHAVFYTFGTVHWRAQGLSPAWAGSLWAIGVIAEIGLFAFSGAVVRVCGSVLLIVAGALAGLVRWTAMAIDPPLAALMGLQVLHGLTFGAAHLGAVHHISATVPANLAGTAQSLYASAIAGVFMGSATLASGPLYAAYGARAYLVMAVLSAVGLAAGMLLLGRRLAPKIR